MGASFRREGEVQNSLVFMLYCSVGSPSAVKRQILSYYPRIHYLLYQDAAAGSIRREGALKSMRSKST